MKKRTYRQTDINKLDWEIVRSQVETREIIFSVDVAKQKFVGTIFTVQGEVIQTIKWKHPQDTSGLIDRLCSGLGIKRLEVVMEPSGTYGDVLRWQFNKRGISVYRVSPRQVHDRAESFDGVPSLHDAKATHIIAKLHREKHSTLWQEIPEKQRSLQGLAGELEVHQQIHLANLNRLTASMARHWPELEYIADLSLVSVLTMLSEFGDPAEIRIRETQAVALLEKTSIHTSNKFR